MYKNKIIYIVVAVSVLLTACTKFVDIKTQGSLVPKETVNYRYLLNNNSAFEQTVQLPDIASDDINIVDSAQMAGLASSSSSLYFVNTYTWQPAIYPVASDTDPDWSRLYSIIYNSNIVLDEVPGSTGSPDSVKKELIAEALVHRADAYLTLVNMYAKPYNSATSSDDPGVPLLTKPIVSGNLTRASVETIYQQLISDLKTAIPYLPKFNSYNTLPSKAAAYAVLARAFLYTGKFAESGLYADSALQIQNTLNNLAVLTTTSYPKRLLDPEIILSKQAYTSNGYMNTALRLSDSVLNLLGTTDLRYSFFTAPASVYSSVLYTGRFFFKERIGNFETRNIGPSVPEMMLIKAEAAARAGDVTAALKLINDLRKMRFTTANYTAINAVTATEALVQVIKERQRELFCRGLRWFDMRRLKDDPLFSRTVTRTFKGVTYSLAPNSNRYVFPIAEYIRSFSPGISQNP